MAIGNKSAICGIVVLAALAFAALPSRLLASEYSERVLILHSYHAGFPWTDEIQGGILSEFRRQSPHFEPFVEYLDWKRFPTMGNLDGSAQALGRKYQDRRFDVVIVSDNAALDFALRYRHAIFKDVPIVFCGVNGYSDALIAGHDRIAGVTEDVDAAGTLEAVLAVLPDTKRVIAVTENTETGRAQRTEVVKAARKFQGKLDFSYPENPALEEVFELCKAAQPGTVLLLGSYGRDRTGRIFPDFGIDLLSAGCAIPIFGMWDFLIGKGALGGSVLSGRAQGREAARLAMRLLDGEASIPVAKTPPTQVMFDYEQLKRFSINANLLPRDALIVHEPVTFFQRHRELIPAMLATMTLMAGAIAVMAVNILARRRVERELDKTKALLAAAIEQSPAGIMIAEAPDVVLTLANPAAERILGVPREPGVTVSYLREEDVTWTCFKPDGTRYKAAELALPRTILEGTSTDNLEMRVKRPDGTERFIMLSSSPIRDSAGEIIAGIIVFSDITSRKRMEDMVVQSEKMLSLGGLAAGMAHEINNPLGIIVHAAQNMQRRLSHGLPGNARAAGDAGLDFEAMTRYLEARNIPRYIGDIIEAGHRASRIVKSMLSFSRPARSERFPVNVPALLDKAVELAQSDYDLKRNYDIKKVAIARDYRPGAKSVLAVENELIQVFLNIIKNAAQAMAGLDRDEDFLPGLWLTVEDAGDRVRVTIEDNGPGMDKATCKRILEPFFTTKKVGTGTGLGLSVTYFLVVNSYGGTFDVCSEPGKGTAFVITLPAMAEE
jgi:PAS domain S-box-containing protein